MGAEGRVNDAEGAAERGAGEPKCEAFWGDRASLRRPSASVTMGRVREENPLSAEPLASPPHPLFC